MIPHLRSTHTPPLPNKMAPSARFAETQLPAEVEDLLSTFPPSTIPSTAAVAGYAFLAPPNTKTGLLFAIAAGSDLDPLPIPLQPNPNSIPPSLSAWPANPPPHSTLAVALAALTPDGTLRIFPSVSLRPPAQDRPRFLQVRVGSALAASVGGVSVPATTIVRGNDMLFVFGGRGSAAVVVEGTTGLEVTELKRVGGERGSLRFGMMFYSAIRSIGGGGRDAEWEEGSGTYEIVGGGACGAGEGVMVVRKGGEVERWGADGLLRAFCVFDYAGGRDAERSVVCAKVTSDDTLVVLVRSTAEKDAGHRIVCFDIRSATEVPKRAEMDVPLGDGRDGLEGQCLMVLSADIAYFYMEVSKTLAWLSVARGVPPEGQVQGNTLVGSDMGVLSVVDAAWGVPEAGVVGGVAGFIHPTGVWLASCAVPPPMSLDREAAIDDLMSVADVADILWRAFLQFCAEQKGAARASLQGLVNFLVAEQADVREILSSVVERGSRRIIVSHQDPEQAPVALLVDTELEKKLVQHESFLKLLADTEVFSGLRPEAPSMTEDCLWNALKTSSRYVVLTDGEKLASAHRVRDLENRLSCSGYYQRFNDAASNSIIGSERIRNGVSSASASRRGRVQVDNAEDEGPSVLNSALRLGGSDISGGRHARKKDESANELYRNPHEFHKFLPALERSMCEALSKLQSEHAMADDNGAADGASYRRGAQTIVLLCCEAAIYVVQGSREARETAVGLLSSLPNALSGVSNWMNDERTCGAVLMKICQKALDVGARSRESEGEQMMRAATIVVDELLSRTPFDDTVRNARRLGRLVGNVQATPRKRRRLDLIFEGTERGKELRFALDMLRKSSLDEDAFRLAEKYGDYGTMLALRVASPDFDEFMETTLRKFGDDFGLFAFRWLEERGEIRLLLRGQNMQTQNSRGMQVGRSARLNALLSDYFQSERCNLSNLSWIHWIAQGNGAVAADDLIAQTKKVAVPEKEGSAINTPILSSIAKLAILADAEQHPDNAEKRKTDHNYLTGRLSLSKLQARLDANSDAFLPIDDLIRQFMEMESVNSDSLAEQVIMAVETLHYMDIDEDKLQSLENFVWRRCVERQSSTWIPIVNKMSTASDIEMRKNLKDTALYLAATRLSLTEVMMSDIIARGAFSSSEFEKHGCTREVTSLVKAAVSLAMA